MLVYCQLLYVLFMLLGVFIDLLPLKVASSCFLLFLVPGELKNKYSPNWKRKLFYEVLYRKNPKAQRGAAGGPQGAHTWPRRAPPCGRAWHRCGPPGHPPAPPFRLFNHPNGKTLDITRKV